MRLSDPATIRALLETDRAWSVYALGDLSPGFFEHCEWHAAQGGAAALLLLYRAFATPVLFALGPPGLVAGLLEEVAAEHRLYLSIRPEILPLVAARYAVAPAGGQAMWRMTLSSSDFRPAAASSAVRLGPRDLARLEVLYSDGQATGEAPDFFAPVMLSQGVFFGVCEGPALVAAAGTHLVAPQLGLAAVGNVYTRRDRRGRGLAAQVTSAVAAELLRFRPPLETVALNVAPANYAAVHVYEKLGFKRYCAFIEASAERDGSHLV